MDDKTKKKLQGELEHHEKELTSFAFILSEECKEVISRVENNKRIYSSASTIQQRYVQTLAKVAMLQELLECEESYAVIWPRPA